MGMDTKNRMRTKELMQRKLTWTLMKTLVAKATTVLTGTTAMIQLTTYWSQELKTKISMVLMPSIEYTDHNKELSIPEKEKNLKIDVPAAPTTTKKQLEIDLPNQKLLGFYWRNTTLGLTAERRERWVIFHKGKSSVLPTLLVRPCVCLRIVKQAVNRWHLLFRPWEEIMERLVSGQQDGVY